MNEIILNTIFQFRRGLSEVWSRNNPILRAGEPGFELDTGKLKIGDGTTEWNKLNYFGGDFKISTDEKSIILNKEQLELAGFSAALVNAIPRKNSNGSLEWIVPDFPTRTEFTELSNLVNSTTQRIQYEIFEKPDNTLIDYRTKEIRIMCSEETNWERQNLSSEHDPNIYYIGLKIYAPNNADGFKKGESGVIIDNFYDFNNSIAGIDQYNRKFHIAWLPAASYDSSANKWTYFGKNSSFEQYYGWDYIIEWYDQNNNIINSDFIRINLSNESCHNIIEDYYMAQYQRKTDTITVDKLANAENTVLIFNGGSAKNAIIEGASS